MTRTWLQTLASLLFAATFAAATQASELPNTNQIHIKIVTGRDVATEWSDFIVFSHFSDCSQSRVKMVPGSNDAWYDVTAFSQSSDSGQNDNKPLIGFPRDEHLIGNGPPSPTPNVIDTIRAQGARIEVMHDVIRITGGTVEITRTSPPK